MPRTGARGGPRTRARIAQVASGLFAERGFEAVTVAEIARQAGVSSVTVFNHFPRKEDLFLDRSFDAAELLRSAIRDRSPDTDALGALRAVALRLAEDRHPLAGLADHAVPFFETVAGSPALVARAREIAAELQHLLAAELDRDPQFGGDHQLFAALVVAGYRTVLVRTAGQRMAGEPTPSVADDHRARLEQLFEALRGGLTD